MTSSCLHVVPTVLFDHSDHLANLHSSVRILRPGTLLDNSLPTRDFTAPNGRLVSGVRKRVRCTRVLGGSLRLKRHALPLAAQERDNDKQQSPAYNVCAEPDAEAEREGKAGRRKNKARDEKLAGRVEPPQPFEPRALREAEPGGTRQQHCDGQRQLDLTPPAPHHGGATELDAYGPSIETDIVKPTRNGYAVLACGFELPSLYRFQNESIRSLASSASDDPQLTDGSAGEKFGLEHWGARRRLRTRLSELFSFRERTFERNWWLWRVGKSRHGCGRRHHADRYGDNYCRETAHHCSPIRPSRERFAATMVAGEALARVHRRAADQAMAPRLTPNPKRVARRTNRSHERCNGRPSSWKGY